MLKGMVLGASVLIAASSACSAGASAAVIFTDSFGSYSGQFGSTQAITGLPVQAAGTLSNWSGSGTNAIHAVQLSSNNWAVMLYQGNAITTNASINANQIGQQYTVSFAGAPAAYASSAQATNANDFVNISVYDNLNSLIKSFDYSPGAFPNTSANLFTSSSFTYAGDGAGGVKFVISDPNMDGNFGGAITNFTVADSVPSAVSEPLSGALLMTGIFLMLSYRRFFTGDLKGSGSGT